MPFSQQLCLSTSRSQRHVPEDRSFTNSLSTQTYCKYAEVRANRTPQMLAAVNMDMVTLPAQVDERLKQEQRVPAGWQKRTTLNESCHRLVTYGLTCQILNSFCAGAARDVLMF